MKSWKTSLFAALAACAEGLKNSHDATLQHIGAILGPAAIFLLGVFARDNNVTSEQAGAGKPNSGAPILGLLLIFGILFFGGTGCAGNTKFIRALATDKNTTSLDSDFSSVWFTHKIHFTRSGSTNSASAGDGRSTINLPPR